jgi:hypothetical protein
VTESLQGALVTKSVLSRLSNELETGVDGLDGLLGLLDGGHCERELGAKEEEQKIFTALILLEFFWWLTNASHLAYSVRSQLRPSLFFMSHMFTVRW